MVWFQSALVIEAKPERVWSRLVDLSAYSAWNPFTPRVTGKLAQGAPVMIHARLGNRWVDTPHRVTALVPNQQLSWQQANTPAWLLFAVRHQILEASGTNSTRFTNRFEMSGVLSPLVNWLMSPDIRNGMELMGQALKKEVETNPEITLRDQ